MKVRNKVLALLFAFTLIAAACGDDEGGDETTTTAAQTTTTTQAQTTTTAGGPADTTTTSTMPPPAVLQFDIGVDPDAKTISLGLLADLTGIFSPLVIDIVDAQQVYWDTVVNAAGGIGGEFTVEVLVEDTNYNVEQHGEKYELLRDEVLAFTQSTGSPTTVAMLPRIIEDGVLTIPLSWYSGWAIPEFDGGFVLEQGTNYCVEAMNLMSFISENGGTTVALITFPGDYGQDSAAGAKLAAAELGIDIVYDGEGVVIPGQDQTPVITEIVNSNPDWVFATTNPSTFAEILGGAAASGYQGMWTGSLPTWDFRLLDSPVAPLADAFFYQSAFNVPWGTDIPGMEPVTAAMQEAFPDRRPSDAFIIGWNEAKVMHQILEAAYANNDLRRASVVDVAQSLEVITLDGVAPDQTYAGTPNDYVVRETAVYKPDLETYLAAGGADQKLADGGTTGSVLAKDFFVSDVAANFDFTEPCYSLG